ncbi:hotdog domain-containing protein [Polluticaenibacter yanchengensis]|uniref:Thioesterase domain-containing protein n=1 Tax=Polluticaenibacter yanchengensis TaxID=3014562 RepID=A0ABT4UML6_9BACT|nr:hypothetical protein [Chitinophagaceae bacterium LY-5]
MDLSQLFKYRDLATSGKWHEVEKLFNNSVQLKHAGAQIDLSNIERPKASITEVQDFHKGGIGSDAINGGVISMLADLALGLLGLQFFKEGMTATAQLQVNYLKPFRTNAITAESFLTQTVGNRLFGTVELRNHHGEVCAVAYGILAKSISL